MSKPTLRHLLLGLGLLVLSLLVTLCISELGLRLFFRKQFEIFHDERMLLYRYDSVLGWFPRSNTSSRVVASRPFTVIHNSDGFRGPEQAADNRPGIMFLGDSFVWGYDVEAAERFTDKLQTRHPEWDVVNAGVSGYGTDQEFLLLQMKYAKYKPKLIFLVYCTETDDDDNRCNVRYGGYYKPYFTVAADQIELHGVPVPRSERAFLSEHRNLARLYTIHLLVRAYFKLTTPASVENPTPTGALVRAMHSYAAAKGAVLAVGLTRSSKPIEEYLRYYKIPFVDLDTPLRYPSNGNHWTPDGHDVVCSKIEKFLLEGNYLNVQAANR